MTSLAELHERMVQADRELRAAQSQVERAAEALRMARIAASGEVSADAS